VKWPLVLWYGGIAVALSGWLAVFVAIWLGGWNVSTLVPPLLALFTAATGALGRSTEVRRARGTTVETLPEKTLKGYPLWW
jgi:hypothetical protein